MDCATHVVLVIIPDDQCLPIATINTVPDISVIVREGPNLEPSFGQFLVALPP